MKGFQVLKLCRLSISGKIFSGAAALSQGLSLRDVVAIAFVVAASTGALAAAARVRATAQ